MGRIVRNGAATCLPFEGGSGSGSFHLPIRCDKVAGESADLCAKCQEKEAKTAAAVAAITGMSIGKAESPFLHGRVTDPVPFWSHIYDGAWFRLKIAGGATVSEENMARAKKAVAALGVAAVEPEPLPAKTSKKKQAVLSFAAPAATVPAAAPAPVAAPVAPPLPAPVPVPPPPPAPAPSAPKKRGPKRAGSGGGGGAPAPAPSPAPTPVAILPVGTKPDPVEDVIRVQVIKKHIDGRDLYYESGKGKVYDLKFRYLGRLDRAAGKITSFPDSDAEN